MSPNIDEILAQARRAEDVVPLCLRGDLNADFTVLERQLAAATSQRAANLEQGSAAVEIAQRMTALREQIRAAEVPFRLRAMTPTDWADFYATLPSKIEQEPDEQFRARWYDWICQLVAHSCVQPVMTAEQVDQLVPALSAPQWDELGDTAYRLNTGKVSVPFSAAACAVMAATGPTSKRPEPPGSASPASSVRSRARSPRTSTTSRAASPAV